MAQFAAPSGGAAPAANPLTTDPAQAFAAVNTVNQTNANVASDCLWPPSAQVTIPIIPGLYSQSFQVPCLVTYSEARAVFGAGLFVAGIGIVFIGINIVTAVAVGGTVVALVTGRGGRSRSPAAAAGGETAAAPAASEVALAA